MWCNIILYQIWSSLSVTVIIVVNKREKYLCEKRWVTTNQPPVTPPVTPAPQQYPDWRLWAELYPSCQTFQTVRHSPRHSTLPARTVETISNCNSCLHQLTSISLANTINKPGFRLELKPVCVVALCSVRVHSLCLFIHVFSRIYDDNLL